MSLFIRSLMRCRSWRGLLFGRRCCHWFWIFRNLLLFLWRWIFAQIVFLFEIFDPWMIKNFYKWKSFGCFINKYFINQIFVLITQTRLKSNLSSHNFITDLSWMNSCERCSTVHQFIQQDSKRPNIQSMIMILVLNHFRGHIFKSSAESVSLLHMVRLNAPTKITNLDDVSIFNQNILWFDISVNQSLFMHVVYTTTYLDKEVEGCIFCQKLFLSDQIK